MGAIINAEIGAMRRKLVAAERARMLLACLEHAPCVEVIVDEDITDDLVAEGLLNEEDDEYLTTWEGSLWLKDYIDNDAPEGSYDE